MKYRFPLLLLAALAASLPFLGGCGSTQVESSWTAPEVGSIQFEKILLIATTPNGSMRRSAEDTLVQKATGSVEAVASYTLLPDLEEMEASAVLEEARAGGFDGIVVMRPISKDTEISSTPATYTYPNSYWTFGGYYGPYWGLSAYYEPATITTDTIIGVEMNIYDVASGELIWSGITRTYNPDSAGQLAEEVASAVLGKMREQKLID